jgi:hypothetical protein
VSAKVGSARQPLLNHLLRTIKIALKLNDLIPLTGKDMTQTVRLKLARTTPSGERWVATHAARGVRKEIEVGLRTERHFPEKGQLIHP